MKYLKLYESAEKTFVEIEDEFKKIIDLNNIDIDLDYIKDISASATDVFSGNKIKYEKYIDIGEENDDGFESWQLVGEERIVNDSSYTVLLNFYKLLFSTRHKCYLTFIVNISLEDGISINNPNIELFKEEVKDIESRCKGENILFDDSISTRPNINGDRIVYDVTMTFRKRLIITKDIFDNRKLISTNLIKDFDTFVSTHNISKDAEDDLVNLLIKAQKG